MDTGSQDRRVQISNPEKVLFPAIGLTKDGLARYYARVAEVMLPHLRGRPLTIQRFPDGIDEPGFFQKQAPDGLPDWIRTARLPKTDGHVDYLVADEPATLAYLANLAAITLHTGLARVDEPHRPDRLVFDLDPSGARTNPSHAAPFPSELRSAALQVRRALDALGLPGFLQTTGSRGLHVVVPILRTVSFDESHSFAAGLARQIATAHPDHLTTEHRVARRRGRIFLDYLRNSYGQTAVAPYSVRALDGAPVATPLSWEELDRPELGARRYTVRNVFRRLGQLSCPWARLAESAVDLRPALRRLGGPGTA